MILALALAAALLIGTQPSADNQLLPDRLARSGDVLLKQALATFPFAVQVQFADRTIRRPSTEEERALGLFDSYFPADDLPRGMAGDIVVGRDEERNAGEAVTIATAIHELLHAVSYEGLDFAADTRAGSPRLAWAVEQNLAALEADPQTASAMAAVRYELASDRVHLFTTLGALYIKGVPLPTAVADYFAPMRWYNPLRRG